ncbi:DNA polymerase-3 subunit epsilon [Ereboglobus sp. PH5-5]|uniref:3'-5' exonuclease n=1 Tax=Ereboglobus sp. PH5-5 TaxID=2940529 RepID=UPI0024051DBD|nr:3'-5' exonuclease [Ereboglobus sp. PH5-5]MDF9831966.1 DNA polymerase-3 subunit epsilon [Ereboglobus sp. PH5-5]
MTWKFWKRPPSNPVVAAYREATSPRPSRKTPVADARFVILDCETSGFDIQANRILSLAIAEVGKGRLSIAKSRSWTVFQEDAPINKAVAIHGILPSQTAGGQPEAEVLLEFLPRIHDAILVGHHILFDIAMLNASLERHYRAALRNPTLDTAAFAMTSIEAFAKTAYPGQHEPSLEEVCAQCKIAPLERHTAEGDTFTTAQIFLSMCALHQRHLGRPLTLADLPLLNG